MAGSGIPIAWRVVLAHQPGSWKGHWQQLINSLQSVIPSGFEVIVIAERGLYADWLFASGHRVFSLPGNFNPPRHISCFVLGLLTLLADILNHLPILLLWLSSFPSIPVDDFFCFNSS